MPRIYKIECEVDGMGNIFMISDMHFGHKHIIRYENRPFATVDEMDNTMIQNWNQMIGKDDVVFVLGDVSFYNKEKTTQIIQSLHGYKTLIIGNHDEGRSVTWWREVGFEEVYRYPIVYEKFYILSHDPLYMSKNMPYANIHGHTHHLKYEDTQFFNVSVECINYTPMRFDEIKAVITKSEEGAS
ncbi:MAG: phosphoesterase [Firmicutes bacterium]|nr:phosphoesterase [Bacillota bacterium]